MTINDKKYKQVTTAIGVSLIFLVVFIQLILFTVPTLLQSLFEQFGTKVSYTVSMLSQIILYLASFMIPAFILRKMLKKRGLMQPMRLEFKMTPDALWLIPAGIAVCFAGSVVNSLIMSLFIPPDVMNSLMETTEPYRPYQIVLQLIATALVPAVCEEFLFRGAVASSLMPFGKGLAIFGSSVLFSFMHENPYQLFYTFIAGLFLGYLYVKTGSILCPTILHFCNNATSVLMDVCNTNLGEERGMVYYYIITVVVYALGAVGVVVYFLLEKKSKKDRFEGGSFGRIIEAENDYAQLPVTKGKKLRYFLTPAMIVYCALAIVNTLSTAIMLWLMSIIPL